MKKLNTEKRDCIKCKTETTHDIYRATEPTDEWNNDYVYTYICRNCGWQEQEL